MADFIAPVANRKPSRTLSTKMMVIIVGCIVALIATVVLMMLSASNNPTESMDRLNARLASLQAIIKLGQTKARDPNLVKITSDASILINGDVATLKNSLKAAGAVGKSKAAILAEKDTETLDKLNTAAVNGVFDASYKTALASKLESTMTLIKSVYNRTKSTSLKNDLNTAYMHCGTIVKALNSLGTTT